MGILWGPLLWTIRFVDAGEVPATLMVWDIGGQTMGGGMLENYVFGADVSIKSSSEYNTALDLANHFGCGVFRICNF